MSETTIPVRSDIPEKYKWNAESVFPTVEEWSMALKSLPGEVKAISEYQNRLHEGPQVLLEALAAIENLFRQVMQIYFYAQMSFSVETTDQEAAKRNSQAQSAAAQAFAATSFLDPELIAIGEPTLRKWLEGEPRLVIYLHYLDDLFRRQTHVRSKEVEELLGLVSDTFSNVYNTASLLTNADLRFPNAVSSDGRSVAVTASTFDNLMKDPDRELRRSAYEGYTDTFLGFKNTLTSNLATNIKSLVFRMRAQRHNSCLEAALYRDNLPLEVFHNLVETFRKNLPTWHRYWAVRRKALGLEELKPYDIWAPLTSTPPKISYEQSVEWITQGLMPLGKEYAEIIRRGCLEQRWVDVLPNVGKWDGAFSAGVPGTYPFILLNFDESVFGLSVFAHELGHSMHSYLTWQNQPLIYAEYPTFAAEVASNFHQAMLRAHLLQVNPERDFQISIIEEAMANFHRYFFIMPTLARFELEIYGREERGEGLAADELIQVMADLFAEAYGSEMSYERERIGITWATFPHMYMNFYVFQYATGIAGAHAFANRILKGVPGAAEAYLGFLKSGNSQYVLDSIRQAGVDLSTPEPVEAAFEVLSELVDRLEGLTG
jgi:oligoendopeptidase F